MSEGETLGSSQIRIEAGETKERLDTLFAKVVREGENPNEAREFEKLVRRGDIFIVVSTADDIPGISHVEELIPPRTFSYKEGPVVTVVFPAEFFQKCENPIEINPRIPIRRAIQRAVRLYEEPKAPLKVRGGVIPPKEGEFVNTFIGTIIREVVSREESSSNS